MGITGSATVQHYVTNERDIHVAREPGKGKKFWWAVGKLGSYGGSRWREEAVAIAKDAAANTGGKVILHFMGTVSELPAATQPSSQFFQDDVE